MENGMRATLYTLEDYFDALAGARPSRVSGALAALLSRVCARLGDALPTEAEWRQSVSPFMFRE
jgi:hypothetical protein